jgi:hypothetical protein
MDFQQDRYTIETQTLSNGKKVTYRAWFGIPYVEHPSCPDFQKLHLFAPEPYFHGETINSYTKDTAPIFMPNTVGGYMPGPLQTPSQEKGNPSTMLAALAHGYVVAQPALRGRTSVTPEGEPCGKGTACLLDYKAAVRFLRHFKESIPGDTEKIITNGTSAGGALSALMGATGDHPLYQQDLAAMGAAEESDSVFAASCYCPITDLDHADLAYEWQFQNVHTFHMPRPKPDGNGGLTFTVETGEHTPSQQLLSQKLAAAFPKYVNSLQLSHNRTSLTLASDGTGSFLCYLWEKLKESAEEQQKKDPTFAAPSWLLTKPDFAAYARDITRMKPVPAFDSTELNTPENHLFAPGKEGGAHFACWQKDAPTANPHWIKQMNPLPFLKDAQALKATHWRIRHGEADRDTSLAIPAILALSLEKIGLHPDIHFPWGIPHAGDYDLPALFQWIDSICR